MPIHYKILIFTRPIQKMIRWIGIKFGLISPNRLRVLIYHDIPVEEENNFSTQILWLKKYWNFVSPEEFEDMLSGSTPIIGNNLLITFDDGLISNRIVAEKILNPMGIKAIFFIVSDFAKLSDPSYSRKFIADNIIPGVNVKDIPQYWENMQWQDLSTIISQGHTVGCHTKTHARLSECKSRPKLEDEILTSAENISRELNIKIKHFAYTFGDIDSISKDAITVIRSRFNFIYSGIRGNNCNNSSLAIRRDVAAYQLESNEYRVLDNKLLSAFLDGFADFRYKKPRGLLDRWSK